MHSLHRIAAGLGIAALLACGSAQAFDNEPDGFRGILWGTRSAEMPKAYQLYGFSLTQTVGDAAAMFGFALRMTPEQLASRANLTAFVRTDDKLEIGDAPLQAIRYLFADGQLLAVVANYVDQPPPALLLGRRGGNSDAKGRINQALRQRFGAPTEAKSLGAALFDKYERVDYMGPVSLVVNECHKQTRQCRLGFASSTGWVELNDRLASAGPGGKSGAGDF